MSVKDKTEFEDEFTGTTDRELIEAARAEIENVRQNIGKESWATSELVAESEAKLNQFELDLEKCEAAETEAKLRDAKLKRSADAVLSLPSNVENSRGH